MKIFTEAELIEIEDQAIWLQNFEEDVLESEDSGDILFIDDLSVAGQNLALLVEAYREMRKAAA